MQPSGGKSGHGFTEQPMFLIEQSDELFPARLGKCLGKSYHGPCQLLHAVRRVR